MNRKANCGEIWSGGNPKYQNEPVIIGCCYDDESTDICRFNGMGYLLNRVISTESGDKYIAKNLGEYYSLKNKIIRFFKK
jgi:hypothetical protein